MLINVNITDITDESGYIEAIGRKAASEAVQQAEIDVAQQQNATAPSAWPRPRSEPKPSMVANAEQVRSEIGTKEAEREQARPRGRAPQGEDGR